MKTAVSASADFLGDCYSAVPMAADGRGSCYGSFLENVRTIGCGFPWVAMVGTTEFDRDRTVARAVATAVAFAVDMP